MLQSQLPGERPSTHSSGSDVKALSAAHWGHGEPCQRRVPPGAFVSSVWAQHSPGHLLAPAPAVGRDAPAPRPCSWPQPGMNDSGAAVCWWPGRLTSPPTKHKVNLNLTALLLRACASSSPSLPALLSVQSLTSTVLSGTVRGCGGNCARTWGRGGRLPSAPCPWLTRMPQHKAASARAGDTHQERGPPGSTPPVPPAHCCSSLESGSCAGTGTQPCPAPHSPAASAWQHRLHTHPAGTSCIPARHSPALLPSCPRGWAPASATPELQQKRTSCCARPKSRIPSHGRSRAALQTLQLSNPGLRHQGAP